MGAAIGWLAGALSTPIAEVGTAQLLDFEVSSKATESSDAPVTEDHVISVTDDLSLEAPFLKGTVSARGPGVSAVQATFDMEDYCLGKASDLMMVLVAPKLEGVEIRNASGIVEDPIDLRVGEKATPHAVGMFSLLAEPVDIAFDPIGAADSELIELAATVIPGLREFTVPPDRFVLPKMEAELDGRDFYPDGDFYFGIGLDWAILSGSITINDLRFQIRLPELIPGITSWNANFNTPSVIDLAESALTGVTVTGMKPGTAQMEVNACLPFLVSPDLSPFDYNGVRVEPCELRIQGRKFYDSNLDGIPRSP